MQISGDPSSLERHATIALQQRRWPEAHSLALSLIERNRFNPAGHYIAGVAALERRQVRDAQDHFEQAIALDPQCPDFRLMQARACASSQDYQAALDAADHAERLLHTDNANEFDTLGVIFVQCHAFERAANAFRRAARLAPADAAIRFNLGTALTFLGDIDGAEHEFEASIGLNPYLWRAHHSLSQLRRQTRGSNHLERLSRLADDARGKVTATTFLNMALAKELDDIGDYENAFDRCVEGKNAPRQMLRYSRSKDAALFESLASAFPSPHSPTTTDGSDSDDPIFIVGMPRSGTTLVDRIASSHPLIQSAGELHNFPSVWKRALGGAPFEMFNAEHIARASGEALDWRKLGDDYVASTRTFTGSRPFFTDKLPHNFLYLGYIACALPRAKIICVRRHPLDTCLGNFRQLFGPESPYFDYSYDLLDTGHYFILFDRLMSHWRHVFPGRILEVQYERLVMEQEQSSRAIIGHCGLDWDDACLSFEKNVTPVTTASAVQVRAPMYTTALARWKHYERQLGPLRTMLEDAEIDCS
ncbi:tetratricopeptide repeat-containing sulfotransferase family protein [Luteimonas terrae]|uniref:Tetratricopeptide (TPR) repeat protein n=1 Tax=Luteimonas terrae TaxID=1530191 RepID=A0ABU1XSA1_9GAMM|nr:sulfotransferase [Luteimonas terrae]MDR7191618.1 tetratricopeptide (TPR) repeat protein [Luteimonas terrae]